MDQPLYQFGEWIAARAGLLWLVQNYQAQLLAGLLILAGLCWLFGFYCYRAVFAGLTLLGVVAASYAWILPVWGAQACVTACAVLGVAMAFLAFRWHRLGGVVLCALIAGSLVLHWTEGYAWPTIVGAIAASVAAGAVTFFFPLLGICGLTALWGAQVLAEAGWRHLNALSQVNAAAGVVAMALLAAAGFALQLALFRKQKLFSQTMPKGLAYRLQKRRERKGAAA